MDLPNIGYVRILIGMDGNAWYAVKENFINLQESKSGWGNSPSKALVDLLRQFPH